MVIDKMCSFVLWLADLLCMGKLHLLARKSDYRLQFCLARHLLIWLVVSMLHACQTSEKEQSADDDNGQLGQDA